MRDLFATAELLVITFGNDFLIFAARANNSRLNRTNLEKFRVILRQFSLRMRKLG